MRNHLPRLCIPPLSLIALSACVADKDPATDSAARTDTAGTDTARTDTAGTGATGPVWGYEEEDGPERWGELSEDWELCASGAAQSPIDISPEVMTVVEDDPLELDWGIIDLYARNTGHSVQYDVYRGSVATNRDGIFDLVQFHFHGGAEHTLQGERYAMEAHFVHVQQDDPSKLLVVALLIDAHHGGEQSRLLEEGAGLRLSEALALPESEEPTELEGVVELSPLAALRRRGYAAYDGSLTTPPCSEGVRFYVLDVSLQPSNAAVEAFHAIYDHNYRPTQPLNGRAVSYTYGG